MTRLKTYCVFFSEKRSLLIKLKAEGSLQAIESAKELFLSHPNDYRFEILDHEDFHDAEAYETTDGESPCGELSIELDELPY